MCVQVCASVVMPWGQFLAEVGKERQLREGRCISALRPLCKCGLLLPQIHLLILFSSQHLFQQLQSRLFSAWEAIMLMLVR